MADHQMALAEVLGYRCRHEIKPKMTMRMGDFTRSVYLRNLLVADCRVLEIKRKWLKSNLKGMDKFYGGDKLCSVT